MHISVVEKFISRLPTLTCALDHARKKIGAQDKTAPSDLTTFTFNMFTTNIFGMRLLQSENCFNV